MIKKIIAVAMAVLFTLCLASCANPNEDGVPEGMQSATLAGEPFKLYVPQNWTLNTSSGVSSAYYFTAEQIMVSARYYTPADPNMTVADYVEYCAEGYRSSMNNYAESERIAAVLGGKDAIKLSYTVTVGEKSVTCFQLTAKHAGVMVTLHCYSSSAMYANMAPQFEKIISSFVLCDFSDPNGEEFTDNKTPEGMEIASGKKLEYRMYVPKTWVCDAASGKSEAYYPESERSNVAISAVTPTASISLTDYFAQCENKYRETFDSYRQISAADRTVDGRTAHSFTYEITVEGVSFTVMETLFTKDEIIYSFTYTAKTEKFAEHLSDVEAMLNAFRFR